MKLLKDVITKESFVAYSSHLIIARLLRELPPKAERKDMAVKAYHIIGKHMKELL